MASPPDRTGVYDLPVGDYASCREGSRLKARWPGLAAAYVGAVVGAGFASGREIAQFFALHGRAGLAGAALAGVLFGWTGATALRRATIAGHQHYGALLRDVCGRRLGAVLDRLGSAFIFVGLVAVTAGAGALGRHLWGWPQWVGVIFIGTALALSLSLGRRAHIASSIAVVPLILLVCLVAGATALHVPTRVGEGQQTMIPWPVAAVLYVAYNLMMAVAGICAAADGRQTTRDAGRAGWVGGAVLGLLCLAVTLALVAQPAVLPAVELPLAAALPAGLWRTAGYPVALAAALWTTGSAAALAIGERLRPHRPNWPAAAVALAAIPFALIGLIPIVAVVYPIMGYAGIPLLVALVGAGVPRTPGPGQRLRRRGWQEPPHPLP